MTRWVARLIGANVLVFFITMTLPEVANELMLVPALILQRPWTLVTYMFVHAGFAHILFNMIALFFFGPLVEARLGARRFLWLYFISGISGALLSFVFTPNVEIVGASGAIFGVMLAFAMYWPREKIYIWGVLPIEARWLVGIMVVLSLYGGYLGMRGEGGAIAHFAHLGGFVGGLIYLKAIEHLSPAARFKRKAQTVPSTRAVSEMAEMHRWQHIAKDDMHPLNRTELDRILDKISTHGIGSLSARERQFLERFSGR